MQEKILYEPSGKDIILSDPSCLSLDLTLDCGQAFRWNKKDSGRWCAVVSTTYGNRYLELLDDVEQKRIVFFDTPVDDFKKIWIPYFDLTRDYEKLCNDFSVDENIAAATKEFYGIRVLKQDPWETLCSFIISQNNNIPRIKGIIDRLCENFGEDLGNGNYAFPTAECISKLNEEDLAPLRAGFRNKYIIDAARKVASGEVDIYNLSSLSLEEAQAELLKIKGVGPKVAQCALLYGCGMVDALPIDVWVKRILAEMYPDGFPPCTKDVRGIAQQYLFHWRRNGKQWQKENEK